MRSQAIRPVIERCMLVAAVVLCSGPFSSAAAQDDQTHVLVLYSTRRDAQIAVVGEREFPRLLQEGLPGELDYYSEFIDRARFEQAGYQSALRDFLRAKYAHVPFDLVIATDDVPLEFLATYRGELFGTASVVFFSTDASPPRLPDSTGLIAELDLRGSVALAIELQPDVEQVFVLTGASAAGRSYERTAKSQLTPFADRIAFTYLAGLSTQELEARLRDLPPRSIVYYLLVERDGTGLNVHPLDYLERVTAASSAPVYCWVDSAMDRGIVGGSLKDQRAQTEATAQLALRVLRGEPADSIPVSSTNINVRQVDWRQLQRWGIDESRIPAGTVIRFREPSSWDRYGTYVLAAGTVLVAQTALIAALLIQRVRRRRAEDQLRGSQAALRTSYDRIRDLGGRLLGAQDKERVRIARELHDDVSQQMALLSMDLEMLGRAVPAHARGLAGEALNRAQNVSKSVHDLSHRLHPAKLRLIGLVSALTGLQREFSHSGLSISFTHDNVPASLAPDVTVCLFRVAQEALQNALKHSGARQVSLKLNGEPDTLDLAIEDDGVGFDPVGVAAKGLGLISMEERVEAIGGEFQLRSARGAGTRLVVRIPLRIALAPQVSLEEPQLTVSEEPEGDPSLPVRADSA